MGRNSIGGCLTGKGLLRRQGFMRRAASERLLALQQRHVDGWAGLDPHLAAAEKEGDRFIYRNLEFRAANFLSTLDTYLRDHPDVVRMVVRTYVRARRGIIENPEVTAVILSEGSKRPVDVIKLQLARYDFSDPFPERPNARR